MKSITNPKLRNHFASAFNELKKKLFNMNENSFSEFFNKPFVQNYNNKGNKLRKSRRHTNHPTSSVKKSLLGSKTDPDWMEARFQETAIIISLINHPQLISKFSIQLSEINFEYKDLDIIYQSISSLNSKTKITRAEVIEKLNEMNGYDVYSKLRSTGHLQVNPFLEEFTSLKEAQLTLDDVLNRKIARQNMIQELSDAQNHIQENNDEALTWLLDQANQFLHQARSGKSIVDPYAEKTLEEDIKQIKDLIKNQIWIKKKSKKKTNH